MKTMNDYKVDQINGTITKKFAAAAGVFGSNEYNTLKQLRTDFPTFQVILREIKRKEGKKSYRNLTYENMRFYITETEGENSPVLAEFDKTCELSKVQSAPYAYVKKWFLDRYKDVFGEKEDSAKAAAVRIFA